MSEVRAKIDQALGWLKWATGAAFVVLVLLLLLEALGVRTVSLPEPTQLIYVAGIYWLTR